MSATNCTTMPCNFGHYRILNVHWENLSSERPPHLETENVDLHIHKLRLRNMGTVFDFHAERSYSFILSHSCVPHSKVLPYSSLHKHMQQSRPTCGKNKKPSPDAFLSLLSVPIWMERCNGVGVTKLRKYFRSQVKSNGCVLDVRVDQMLVKEGSLMNDGMFQSRFKVQVKELSWIVIAQYQLGVGMDMYEEQSVYRALHFYQLKTSRS